MRVSHFFLTAILVALHLLSGCTRDKRLVTRDELGGMPLRVVIEYDPIYAYHNKKFSKHGISPPTPIIDGYVEFVFILRNKDGFEIASYDLPRLNEDPITKGFEITLPAQHLTACVRRIYKKSVIESDLTKFYVNAANQLIYINYGWIDGPDRVRQSHVSVLGDSSVKLVTPEIYENKYFPLPTPNNIQ